MNILTTAALCGLPLIAACATIDASSVKPTVQAYNGHSVTIRVPNTIEQLTDDQQSLVVAKIADEADRTCRSGGAKRAKYASIQTVKVSEYLWYHDSLYICVK